jgi:hypothetical protein
MESIPLVSCAKGLVASQETMEPLGGGAKLVEVRLLGACC